METLEINVYRSLLEFGEQIPRHKRKANPGRKEKEEVQKRMGIGAAVNFSVVTVRSWLHCHQITSKKGKDQINKI